jgi:RNA polymerase sigma factor (sigma-70 family)
MTVLRRKRLDELCDADLLRVTRREPEAFGVLYDRHARELCRWLEGRTRDAELALDLTSETFVSALRAAPRFRNERAGSALPWLRAIALNHLTTHYRRASAEGRAQERAWAIGAPIDGTGEQEDALERLATDGRRVALQRAMDRLPAEQQAAVALRIVEEMPYEKIGATSGSSAVVARSRVSRALRSLRSRMEE